MGKRTLPPPTQCTAQPREADVCAAEAGYAVPERGETELIETAQRLLGGYYRPETLDTLLADKLAISLPLDNYLGWLTELPELPATLVERWGDPAAHWALRQIEGQPHFVIPAIRLGNVLLLPQPPRAGRPGEAYHDSKVPPDHLYLAAYQALRGVRADALIHFGTHGTQEWLPGKDRGSPSATTPPRTRRPAGVLPLYPGQHRRGHPGTPARSCRDHQPSDAPVCASPGYTTSCAISTR